MRYQVPFFESLVGLDLGLNPDLLGHCRILGLMSRVFTNGPEDLGSISGQVIPKIQKMVLDVTLLSSQHSNVRIMGKVEQSRESSRALLDILV